jgi:enoyl-CoA hydratase/carnithine racemase
MPAEVVVQGELTRVELEGAVATLRLDRPPVNALNLAVQVEILAAARWIASSQEVHAVVIYGGPKMFAAGADIKEMAAMSYQDMASASHLLQESFNAVAALPMPVVAAVTGFALGGGCELALCADLRVVGERARFGQPEVLLGVIPGLGGTQRLPRLIGPSRAKDMILTGRYVGADEARTFGLADRVVADEIVYGGKARDQPGW